MQAPGPTCRRYRADERRQGEYERARHECPPAPGVVTDRAAAENVGACPDTRSAQDPRLRAGAGVQGGGGADERGDGTVNAIITSRGPETAAASAAVGVARVQDAWLCSFVFRYVINASICPAHRVFGARSPGQISDGNQNQLGSPCRDRACNAARFNAPDPETFHDDARFALDALPALTARADQIKQLRQTVINLAIRGELVSQDPKNEPASKLLKRIENRRLLSAARVVQKNPVELLADADAMDLPKGGRRTLS